MTTTHLFVELLVIGFGGLIWLFLALAPLLGIQIGTATAKPDLLLALPILSTAYMLGILIDRVADYFFDSRDQRLRDAIYPGTDGREDYFKDRRTLVMDGQPLWEHLEYGRSRMRVCRGWAVNFLLIAGFAGLDLVLNGSGARLGSLPFAERAWLFMALAALCFLSVCSWWSLTRSEYQKIKRQAEWLRQRV